MTTELLNHPTGTVTEWSDEQWMNFKDWLESVLFSESIEVVFTKTDGTERVMQCTMNYQVIDAGVKVLAEKRKAKLSITEENDDKAPLLKVRKKPPPKQDNLTVWDTEAGDWRSFRVRSLTNVLALIMRYDYRETNYKFGW